MFDSSFVEESFFVHGPSFHLDLAPLDARHPVYYSRRLLIFRCDSLQQRNTQLAALKTGLQALVIRCPILGGIVTSLPPDQAESGQHDWRTIIPGDGLELLVRDLRNEMISFKELEAYEFPVDKLPKNLLMPIPPNLGNDQSYAACKVQFSAINGGTIITWATSHSVADGVGTNELLSILSEQTRLAQDPSSHGGVLDNSVAASIGMDRNFLRNITSDTMFNIKDHPAYKLKSASPDSAKDTATPSPHPFHSKAEEVPTLLRISARGLVQLKSDATLPGAPRISTHDAITALMWRTVLLIRSRRSKAAQDLPLSTIGSIFMPTDARRHLDLPASYIGNAVYQHTADLDIGTLFSPSGLQHAASAIRAALTSITPEGVASMMALLREEWVDWKFMGAYETTGVAIGTGWTSRATYVESWGSAFGPLVRLRSPGAALNCVFPKLPDGGADVVVAVLPEEVDVLKGMEGFGKYTEIQ